MSDQVRGLARIVQVSSTHSLVDLTIRGLSPGTYWATIRQTGDISSGAASAGGVWGELISKLGKSPEPKGLLGTVDVGPDGRGSVFLDRPLQIWELIGRSMIVSRNRHGEHQQDDPNTLVGVIARSAGAWDNDKTVCSCSGKTLWEERKEKVKQGIL